MQRIAILYDASQAVLSTFDLDEVLNQVLAIVRDYFHLQSGSIMLLDDESQKLVMRAHFSDGEGSCPTIFPFHSAKALLEQPPRRAARSTRRM